MSTFRRLAGNKYSVLSVIIMIIIRNINYLLCIRDIVLRVLHALFNLIMTVLKSMSIGL